MEVAELVAFPEAVHLRRILKQPNLDIVSPFLSNATLAKLSAAKHKRVRLVTRLPRQFASPPAFLDNHPRFLRDAMKRLGPRLQVYALPDVHAKLYVGAGESWLGSANFTQNGFSGKAELMLRFDGKPAELTGAFAVYRKDATRVNIADMDKLVEGVKLGLTRVKPHLSGSVTGTGGAALDEAVTDDALYADFRVWLAEGKGPRKTLLGAIRGKNSMSGHARLGFQGVLAFLRKNPAVVPALLASKDLPVPHPAMKKLKAFILKHGDHYRGPRKGWWRKYLSTDIGGEQNKGGAGDAVVKRLLIVLPDYLRDRGLL